LGTLNEVLPVRYPYGVVGLDYSVTQAHNIVLDTALSMGLVGAAGLLLALGGALWCGLRGDNNRADPGTSTAGTRAFTAVLITFTVFGTTDSLGFSSASSLVFWAALAGLIWVSRGEGSAPHT
jgi:O-antigen ligase